MDILLVNYEFPPLVGGAGSYARDLAVGLSKNGCQVTVLTFWHKPKAESLREDKELFIHYSIKVKRITPIKKIYIIQLFLRLKILLRSNTFDFIIFNDCGAKKMAAFFCYFLKKVLPKSLSVFHGSEVENYFLKPNLIFRLLDMPSSLKKMFKTQVVVIAVSQSLKQTVLETIPEIEDKIKVVPHGIDGDLFAPLPERSIRLVKKSLGLCEKDRYILTASRLIKEKGQDIVLKAFSEVHRVSSDIVLVIAGDGLARKYLESLAYHYGLGEHVIFIGSISRSRLAELYGACEVYIMLSRLYESFGLVFIEANACGRVVVGGRIGGVAEAIKNGYSGFLIDPMDWVAAAKAILKLTNDPILKKQMELTAYEHFERFHSCSVMAQKTLELITDSYWY